MKEKADDVNQTEVSHFRIRKPWKKEYMIDVPIGTAKESLIYFGILAVGLLVIEIADLGLKNMIWVMGFAIGFLELRRLKRKGKGHKE